MKERYENYEPIFQQIEESYNAYLKDLPDYGGKDNNHSHAIYGAVLVFSFVQALPERIPNEKLQGFIEELFMGQLKTLGKLININRPLDMRLAASIFINSAKKDQVQAQKYPDTFITEFEPYDVKNHAVRYSFTQCPNAQFAKKYNLLHILPLMCNSDFYGISQIHGKLIRCSTCGNGNICDYLIVGNQNPIAKEYETVMDEGGFLVSRRIRNE